MMMGEQEGRKEQQAVGQLELTSDVEIGVQPICQETNHLDTFGDNVLLGAVETDGTPIVEPLALAEMNEVACASSVHLLHTGLIIIDCSDAIGCCNNLLIG